MEIAKNIYWIGHEFKESSLQCNPYLMQDGKQWVLFDPGSPLDFPFVLENLKKHVPVRELDYIILSHQDPDLCASTPLLEKEGFRGKIVLHWRTSVIVKYYGVTSEFYLVDQNNFRLDLDSGRRLEFIHTPYLHFPGSMITYDPQSKVLFTGDLFGSFSNKWNLFAEDGYIESMKTFHEHYMPGNEILKPIMNLILALDIVMIAPQHGSIIRDRIPEHISALRDLECGSFLNPIRKELFNAGGYQGLCNQVLKRLYATYAREEVTGLFSESDIILDPETLLIDDFNCTGEELWDLFFEMVYAKRGHSWLNVIEVLVKRICTEYDIALPAILSSTFYDYEKKVDEMSREVIELAKMNARLEENLQSTKESLITCPVTKLYNGFFFKNYMEKEITHAVENRKDFTILFIEIDDFGSKCVEAEDSSGEETLRFCGYLFESLKEETHLLFKLSGPTFALYLPSVGKEDGVKIADHFRSELERSEYSVCSLTASIGVASFNEMYSGAQDVNEVFNDICDLARIRLASARKQGMNIVCSESDLLTAEKRSRGTVLIAEPDPLNADILKTLIEQAGYDTIICSDGEVALHEIYTNTPMLVIAEEVLPKMDGFQIREKMLLSSAVKSIPYILLGYNKDEPSVKRAYELSVSNYLKKPYMASELLGIITSISREQG